MAKSFPDQVTAGDRIIWTASVTGYSAAASWVLSYRLANSSGLIDITASASGAAFLVDVPVATSKSWAAGRYQVQGYVTKGTDRYTVESGFIQVLPNLAAAPPGWDGRSSAETILAQLQAAYQTYLTNGQGLMQRYTIGTREVWFRSSSEFIQQINYWKAQVEQEQVAASVAAGLGNPRRYRVRF